jgi:hypothetical protein
MDHAVSTYEVFVYETPACVDQLFNRDCGLAVALFNIITFCSLLRLAVTLVVVIFERQAAASKPVLAALNGKV